MREQRKQKLVSDIRLIYRRLPLACGSGTPEFKHARYVLESVLAMKTAELRSLGGNWH